MNNWYASPWRHFRDNRIVTMGSLLKKLYYNQLVKAGRITKGGRWNATSGVDTVTFINTLPKIAQIHLILTDLAQPMSHNAFNKAPLRIQVKHLEDIVRWFKRYIKEIEDESL